MYALVVVQGNVTSGVLVAVFSGHKTSETESNDEMVNIIILPYFASLYLSI